MLLSAPITNTWYAHARRPLLSTLRHHHSSKVRYHIDDECDDFLPWLQRMAGTEISSVLSIGKSAYGRSLFASKHIQTGDCILKVPFSAQLAPDNLPPEIVSLIGNEVSNIAKVALLILFEKRLGKDSQWAPYISRLPQSADMHNTIFWTASELNMIKPSTLYEETIKQKTQIEKNFQALKMAFDHFPDVFQDVTVQEFRYTHALVTSRAWESSRGVSMIPFADFFNHDGLSEACVLSDDSKRHSEVIADHDYAPGDQFYMEESLVLAYLYEASSQKFLDPFLGLAPPYLPPDTTVIEIDVFISYGKFCNATLLLDFGFTRPYNTHDQVEVELNIPDHDHLRAKKMELVHKFETRRVEDVNSFNSSWNSFAIKEVKLATGKGKGIPQSLRAFARILCLDNQQELEDLATEAAQNDGRLARHPMKNKRKEIEAHGFLLSKVNQMIEKYNAFKIQVPTQYPHVSEKLALRRRLAQDLLTGELRVLNSASAWLKNYCSTLLNS